MGDTEYMLDPALLNSIVLGAAETAAGGLGYTIQAPALDLLLRESLHALNEANEKGMFEAIRGQIEQNTAQLIQFIVREQIGVHQPTRVITFHHMTQGLSAFCRRFPYFIPFCTKG